MSEDAHIIEIDSIVLDGVAHLRPFDVRALVTAEVRRALLGTGLPAAPGVATSEAAVADAVSHSVDRAIKGGARDA